MVLLTGVGPASPRVVLPLLERVYAIAATND